MHKAMDSAAKALDADIIWRCATQSEAEQEKEFKEYCSMFVNGIIFEPVNILTAGDLVVMAQEKGIPVISINHIPEGKQTAAFVMPDINQTAKELFQYTIDHGRREGRAVILTSETADSTENMIVNLLIKYFNQNYIDVWTSRLSFDSVDARNEINSAIIKPTAPSSVISTHPLYALIASDILRLQLVTPRPILLCAGDSPDIRNAVKSGNIDGYIDMQQDSVGVKALQALLQIVHQKPVTAEIRRYGNLLIPTIITPVRLKTEENY